MKNFKYVFYLCNYTFHILVRNLEHCLKHSQSIYIALFLAILLN